MVVSTDVVLSDFERGKLGVALQYPDLFEQSTYAHLFYKAMRHSRIDEARGLAQRLSRNVDRFGRFERCWRAREIAARERAVNVQPRPQLRFPTAAPVPAPSPQPLFQLPVLRPAHAMAGLGLMLR